MGFSSKATQRILQQSEEALAGPGLQGTERAVSSAKRSLIDGHKDTIGLAKSQWESARSSVGRVKHSETDPPLFTAVLMCGPGAAVTVQNMKRETKSEDKPELSVQNY